MSALHDAFYTALAVKLITPELGVDLNQYLAASANWIIGMAEQIKREAHASTPSDSGPTAEGSDNLEPGVLPDSPELQEDAV